MNTDESRSKGEPAIVQDDPPQAQPLKRPLGSVRNGMKKNRDVLAYYRTRPVDEWFIKRAPNGDEKSNKRSGERAAEMERNDEEGATERAKTKGKTKATSSTESGKPKAGERDSRSGRYGRANNYQGDGGYETDDSVESTGVDFTRSCLQEIHETTRASANPHSDGLTNPFSPISHNKPTTHGQHSSSFLPDAYGAYGTYVPPPPPHLPSYSGNYYPPAKAYYYPADAPPPLPTKYGLWPPSSEHQPKTKTSNTYPSKPPHTGQFEPYSMDDEIASHLIASWTKTSLYEKLSKSEIRLIRIPPRAKHPLKLEILHTSIKKSPPYTALSYAWGDTRDKIEIKLNGQPFHITSSLYEALRMLQKDDRDRLCWADALSINQMDPTEVTEQVQMMKDIYSVSSSVAIWLGPETDDSDVAVELLDTISSHVKAGNDSSVRQLIETLDARRSFTALVALFERDYWRRLWVVQEVLNAKYITVHCGSSVTPWSAYRRATDAFRRNSTYIDQHYASWLGDNGELLYVSSKDRLSFSTVLMQLGPGTFQDIGSLLQSELRSDFGAAAQKFLQALCMCRSKFATDSRDKVYGVLGLVPDTVQRHIVPDYSLSIKDVYTNAAEYIISATQRLDVLGNAFHFPVHLTALGLPTWVPDWSHTSPMTAVDWPMGRFTAGGTVHADVLLDSQHHRVLDANAIPIDTVYQRGVPVSTVNTADDFVMSFLHWFAMLQSQLRDVDEDERQRKEEAFCRLLVLDNIHPQFTSPGEWRRVTFYLFASLAAESLPELPLHPRLAKFAKDSSVDMGSTSRNGLIQEAFSPGMTGRCFFFTKAHIMGMGSGYLAVGDKVVVPLGCSAPLLLRRDGSEDEYRLVSDAYLDGYMYGRAVEDWDKGIAPAERFYIH